MLRLDQRGVVWISDAISSSSMRHQISKFLRLRTELWYRCRSVSRFPLARGNASDREGLDGVVGAASQRSRGTPRTARRFRRIVECRDLTRLTERSGLYGHWEGQVV